MIPKNRNAVKTPLDAVTTLSRRSLLSWLGNAAVIALGTNVLASCAAEQSGATSTGKRQPKQSNPNPGTFAFAPSEDNTPIYEKWWGNTVDVQDLEKILATWQLRVDGLVETPVTLSFADLRDLPRQDQITDFHCVEGWSVFDVPWSGFHIDKLIEMVKPTSKATHITLRCFGDIYTESLPLTVAREPRSMLAYGIDGNTLPLTHGFPLRMVVPRMYGYKNAKWVKQIEFTNASVDGYWEQRGYSSDAPVIAARLRTGKY